MRYVMGGFSIREKSFQQRKKIYVKDSFVKSKCKARTAEK
jgi:hypothetical protein